MTLNRTIQPSILPVKKIGIPDVETCRMPNGVQLYYLNFDLEDVVRLDIVINSGKWDASRPLEVEFTNQLLKEGTRKLIGSQIAEKLDFHGAWLQTSTTQQASYLTLYTLNKYFDNMLDLLEQILKEPTFPEKEFEILLQNRKKDFQVNLDKVNFLAGRAFVQALFGAEHPYGRVSQTADFETITVEHLKQFYENHYSSHNMQIALFGKIEPSMLKLIENRFGQAHWGIQPKHDNQIPVSNPSKEKHLFVEKKNALQSSVFIGKEIITRTHPDFHGLSVLNTVFGGYFGSRLMSNIREEKGYTYGIYSSIAPFLQGGYFYVASQTATEYVKSLIKEVYNEMDKLSQDVISEKELETVRNYSMGELIRRFDNSFSLADIQLDLLEHQLDKTFYEKRIDTLNSISAEELQLLAQKYFVKEEFYEVVAGKE